MNRIKHASGKRLKKVIYHGFSDKNRCSIVDRLHERYNWVPVLMLGLDGESKQIKNWSNKFNDLVLLDTMKLRTADFDYSYIGESTPIDREVLDKLSRYESSYLDNLDDVTGWAFSFTERRSFYRDMLKYMNSILHNFQPDLVVFSTWPHTNSCLAMYYLCKHCLNIDVIFLDAMPLFGGGYHFVGDSIEDLHIPFMSTYESIRDVPMDNEVSGYLEGLRSIEGETTGHVMDDYMESKRVPLSLVKKMFVLFFKVLGNQVTEHEKLVHWKKNQRSFHLKSSRLGNFEYLFFKINLIIKNKFLYRSYKSLCSEVDLNRKYIYFAANYQPEASTLHSSRSHEDIILVLDMLSKYAPTDWVIYYKEHPYTFSHNSLSTLSKRSKAIYKKISQYSNVQLILPEGNAFQLIDKSQVVASIAGTSTWQAAVRGIPSMCFGSVWYKGCKSILSIDNIEDLQAAFRDIANGYMPDSADVDRYAASAAFASKKGMIHERFEKHMNLSSNKIQEIDRIAVAIYEGNENLNQN